ncbi:MAG: GNAT family N-acetyltransferase [Chitinophagaceae bacterium]|nr:GNAT family N-acetyltransferase [Chitinophagaceae bacterium]
MSNVIHIRKAERHDSGTIVDLGRRTFVETYAEVGGNEALEAYVRQKFSPEKIEEELNNPFARFYIGFVNDIAVAFTKLRNDRKAKGLEEKKAVEIERIYVLKEYQGFKVGKEMMEKCRQLAIEEKYDTIWLQVWQHNSKAISFYQKAGFVVFETAVFNFTPTVQQDDFLMRLDLYY